MKYRLFVLGAFTLLMGQQAMAGDVTPVEAERQARDFLLSKSHARRAAGEMTLHRLTDNTVQQEHPAYYAFNVGQNNGFVLVSGSDLTDAVIGYSDSGALDLQHLPDNMRAWLQGYTASVRQLESAGTTATSRRSGTSAKAPIAPLTKSQWNQGAPYNSLCPILEKDKRSATGCVITAIAQVMYYYRSPQTMTKTIPGYSFDYEKADKTKATYTMPALEPITFEWDKMRPTYQENETGEEVARLMQYLGAATQAQYCLESTNATGYKALEALQTYFGYDKGARVIWRAQHSYTEWIDMLYAELDAKRPVFYSGTAVSGAHAYVVDGYAEDDFFHINWGWGGTSDGYFRIVLMNPTNQGIGGTADDEAYTMDQVAFFGVQPDKGSAAGSDPLRLTLVDAVLYGPDEKGVWGDECTEAVSPQYTDGYVLYSQINTRNYNNVSTKFDWGLRLVKDDGTLTRDYLWTTKDGKDYGINYLHSDKEGDIFYLNPAQDPTLTNGGYKLYFLCRQSGTEKWQMDINADQLYIQLTLNHQAVNGTMTARLVDNRPHLRVNSVTFSETPMVGVPVEVCLSLTNTSATNFSQDMRIVTTNNGEIGGQACDLASGETKEVRMLWKPKEAGACEYTVMESEVRSVHKGTVTVSEKDYTDNLSLGFAFKVTNADQENKIAGRTALVDITVTNNNSQKYRGNVAFFTSLWKKGDTKYYNQTYVEKAVTVNANASTTVTVETKELTGADWIIFEMTYSKNGKYVGVELPDEKFYQGPYFTIYDTEGHASSYSETSTTLQPGDHICAIDLTTAQVVPAIDRSRANPNLLVFTASGTSVTGDNVVKDGVAENIRLTDGYPFFVPKAFKAKNISYTRKVDTSFDVVDEKGWTTLVVPFAATDCHTTGGGTTTPLRWTADNADFAVMQFQEENGSELTFVSAGDVLDANRPYLLGIPAKSHGGLALTGQDIVFTAQDAEVSPDKNNATGRNYRMTATYKPLTDQKDIYVLNSEGSAFVRGTASVSPFHAYFVPVTTAAQDQRLTMMANSVLTAIGRVKSSGVRQQPSGWYDLHGRKLSGTPNKGIYIYNGKKVMYPVHDSF